MPGAWIPSEEIEIVFCITRKSVHHQRGKRDENCCYHKDFHQKRKCKLSVFNTTLQTVADNTVDRSCVEIPNFQATSLST